MTDNRPLWAPWRLDYIVGTKAKGCVFCPDPNIDNKSALILYESGLSIVMLNKFPYNSGHLLIIPKRHLSDLTDLSIEEESDLMRLTSLSLEILREAYAPMGFNIGMNIGSAAGAGIAAHLHQHIVPRWDGDNNFMPVLGETRVIPEHIDKSYDRLSPLFAAL